jgi:hypothetical protein
MTLTDAEIEDKVYPKFNEGYKLDPWLHKTDRPWSTAEGYFIWNLVQFESEDTMPTGGELTPGQLWLIKTAPLIKIGAPTVNFAVAKQDDPIVDEAIISYDLVAEYALQGYEMPTDKTWAKNRLARLRLSAVDKTFATKMMEALPLDYVDEYVIDRKARLAQAQLELIEAEQALVLQAEQAESAFENMDHNTGPEFPDHECGADMHPGLHQDDIDKINEEIQNESENTSEKEG